MNFGNTSTQNEEDKVPENDNPLSIKVKKDEYLMQIRKTERHKILQKRRLDFMNSNQDSPQEAANERVLKDIVENLFSNDEQSCYTSLVALRVMSNLDLNFLGNFERTDDIISILIKCADLKDNTQLQGEAIKIIANISAGDHLLCQKLIDLGFIDLAVKSFDAYTHETVDQMLLILGNIISESIYARDMVIKIGVTDVIVNYIEQFNSKNGMWAFCNLFRGRPSPGIEFSSKYIPFLMKKIGTFNNQSAAEISEDCLWTLLELTEEYEMNMFLVENNPYLLTLFSVLDSEILSLITPVLRIINSIFLNAKGFCNEIMNEGLAGKILQLLSIKNIQVKKECCTLLSNLVSNNAPLTPILINTGIISKLLHIIRADSKELGKEAILILSGVMKTATTEQALLLSKLKMLEVVSELLTDRDTTVIGVALDIIYEFMCHGEELTIYDDENYFIVELDSLRAIQKIEDLSDSPNKHVEKKAIHILRKFFEVEEDQ